MKIQLPPDLEQALAEHARQRGTTPQDLALESLRERFLHQSPREAGADGHETLADFLREHIGVLHSSEKVPGGARMSESSGRQFAEGLLQKRRQGHL